MFKKISLSIKGFTLIELLIVISIIADLSTIGLVVFSGVQQRAGMSERYKHNVTNVNY